MSRSSVYHEYPFPSLHSPLSPKASRLHRLPHRLDYTLIPAPLSMQHILFIRSVYWRTNPRSFSATGNGKIAFTCHYRYALFAVIISWFFHCVFGTSCQILSCWAAFSFNPIPSSRSDESTNYHHLLLDPLDLGLSCCDTPSDIPAPKSGFFGWKWKSAYSGYLVWLAAVSPCHWSGFLGG